MPAPELFASDIQWNLQPFTPEPADDDPLIAAILEAVSYRLVMTQTLAAMHTLHRQHDRLREQYQRVEDQYRDLREQKTIEAAE